MPLLPVLLRAARRAVYELELSPRPLRVLELGASLGHWGMAFAAAQPLTTIVAVDAAEVLPLAQRIIASTKLSSRYCWSADGTFATAPTVGTHHFDVVVLHEICHTLQPDHLAGLLDSVVGRLAPDGTVIICDMLLDATRTAPRRHLLSALKLLVTGGSTLLDVDSASSLFASRGLDLIQHDRLAITDLLIARRSSRA